ncbi:hypothetical protein KDA_66960 [Dictyobacter alpinus]|uniref:Pentapeptide repeat-containing protein n=1 Tax=Dictyobacter alpinus TaxID=2014873 RepID=A0A402BJ03_9CHLR|nr:pentapeptide repeat-containing protein [Dictyobacter alpinus]GCE31212.1 hypothetical protein KDA_66960 [Dictyobacter alpinus]
MRHRVLSKGIAIALVVSIVAIMAGYHLNWTGFQGRTLWDWLNLLGVLAIPVVVGVGTAWLSTEQAREAALHGYLDKMAELLLNENLRESKTNTEVRAVARTRTWTVLRLLDPGRRSILFMFLAESELISIIDLSKANFSGADLSEADLRGADLRAANLSNADLRGANLDGLNLLATNVTTAQLLQAKSLEGTIMPNKSRSSCKS